MVAQSGSDWVPGVTAVVALLGAVLGVLRYFNYRTKRDRIALVGEAFETVVEALASDSDVKRLAAAVRLRRFFDPHSEVGIAAERRRWRQPPWAAYARDALNVIAGVLREQPAGNFQKLLADGLTYAPSLVDADLQRTNLQRSYLGYVDASGADFYRADLSYGSLRLAAAPKAQFYQARLLETVFQGANLERANFFEADLTGAKFGPDETDGLQTRTNAQRARFDHARLVNAVFAGADLRHASFRKAELDGVQFQGAQLADSDFSGARDIPDEVDRHLVEGKFVGPDEPLQIASPTPHSRTKLFLSRPSVLTTTQQHMLRQVEAKLTAAGAEIVCVPPSEYPPVGALVNLRQAMASCSGVVVLGFRQLEITAGCWRPSTPDARSTEGLSMATPWNQVEVGIATALALPVFAIREPGVVEGIFEVTQDAATIVVDIDEALEAKHAGASLERWMGRLVH
jgi:Pentapeptide repeats (8 copies)